MDIEGNELADREAKLAAKRAEFSSPQCEPPPSLRNQLPCSISALKQAHSAKQRTLWANPWKKSPRYSRISHVDPTLPTILPCAYNAERSP